MYSIAMMKHHTTLPHQRRIMTRGFVFAFLLAVLAFLINEKNWYPLKTTERWNATASHNPAWADRAIDQNIATFWSSHVAMSSGMYFQVELEADHTINGIVLRADSKGVNQPFEWIIKVSSDGQTWQTLLPSRHIRHKTMLAIFWQPVRTRYLQIIQTSISATMFPWKIHELHILHPILPWQFTRSTLFSWGIGLGLIGALAGLARLPAWRRRFPDPYRRPYVAICLLVLLAGWALRAYQLDSHELFSQEIFTLWNADFAQTDHLTWLTEYFTRPESGDAWLLLLSMRLVYQWLQNAQMAMRIIPALAGVLTGLLLLLPGGLFSSIGDGRGHGALRAPNLERLLAAALITLSGTGVWQSRIGAPSMLLCFLVLAYLLLIMHVLFEGGTVLWLPVCALITLAGILSYQAFILFPLTALITAAFALALPKTRVQISRRHLLARWVLALGATLFALLLWRYIGHPRQIFPEFSWQNPMFENLGQVFEYAGLTHAVSVVWWGFALLGFAQFMQRRRSAEGYCYGTLLFFTVVLNGFAPFLETATYFLLILVVLFIAKGLAASYAWILETPRVPWMFQHRAGLMIVSVFLPALYFGGFTWNSLFGGVNGVPLANSLFQRVSQDKQFTNHIASMRKSPDDCAAPAISLDPNIPEYLSFAYGIRPLVAPFPAILMRQAEEGIAQPYLFTSPVFEELTFPGVLTFIKHYYTLYSESENIRLYRLRDSVPQLPRRYLAEDFLSATGSLDHDDAAMFPTVLRATQNDPPGLLAFWPPVKLCGGGRYRADFMLRSRGGTADDVVAELRIAADIHDVLAYKVLTGRDFPDDSSYRSFSVEFTLPNQNPAYDMKQIQFLVSVTGKADVRLSHIDLLPASPEP